MFYAYFRFHLIMDASVLVSIRVFSYCTNKKRSNICQWSVYPNQSCALLSTATPISCHITATRTDFNQPLFWIICKCRNVGANTASLHLGKPSTHFRLRIRSFWSRIFVDFFSSSCKMSGYDHFHILTKVPFITINNFLLFVIIINYTARKDAVNKTNNKRVPLCLRTRC